MRDCPFDALAVFALLVLHSKAMAPALRRSRRGQPALPFENSKDPQAASSSSSSANPIHTRRVHVAEDLTSDQWNELLGESADIKTVQTHFYSGLDVHLDAAPKRLAKGKRPAASNSDDGDGVLRVGDTVLVGGERGSSHELSVAVVTGIVKVTKAEEVFCVNVRVRWFVRPTQLPSVRAERAHEEVSRIAFICFVLFYCARRDVEGIRRQRYTILYLGP
jgi:origin recognition complex subunit 1